MICPKKQIAALLMLLAFIGSASHAGRKSDSPINLTTLLKNQTSLPTAVPSPLYPSWIGYPDYTKHCETNPVEVVLTNITNQQVSYTVTIEEDFSPFYSNWLAVQDFSGSIGVAPSEQDTGTLVINALGAAGVCNAGVGEIVALYGRLIFEFDETETYNLEIQAIIADTVVLPAFDTISTSCIDLVLSSNGNAGNSGAGSVNMDFAGPGEWKEGADVYMFDASLVIGWIDGTDTVMHWSMYNADFSDTVSFKPLGGEETIQKPWAEIYSTGVYTVRDSSLAIETKWYAPVIPGAGGETHCAFMMKETKVYTLDGLPRTGLVIGEVVDWDIPSDSGAANSSLWGTDLVPPVDNAVLQRGIEITGVNDDDEGWDADERYAALVFIRAYAYDGNGNQYGAWAEPQSMYTADNLTYVNPYTLGFDEGLLYQNHVSTGFLSDSTRHNLHSGLTYLSNFSMAGDDTLYFYCAYVTQMNSTYPNRASASISNGISDAVAFFSSCLTSEDGCCLNRGDVNHSGGGVAVDVLDIIALVSYLFEDGSTPNCLLEADANGDNSPWGPDILDLLAIVSYLFQGAGALPECPGPCDV